MGRLFDWGLVDTFRKCHPERDDQFSWFDYRSRGFEATPPRGLRIDLILASAPLAERCVDAGIDYDVRAMCDGQTIDCFVDGGNKISYGSAALNETETEHGLFAQGKTDRFDNFAVYPRTAAVFDATLDEV